MNEIENGKKNSFISKFESHIFSRILAGFYFDSFVSNYFNFVIFILYGR